MNERLNQKHRSKQHKPQHGPRPLHFEAQENVYPEAKKLFDEQERRILDLVPQADVQHVGSSAIPKALTVGDLDIQVRVSQSGYKDAVDALRAVYHENHPEKWTDELALFHDKEHPIMPLSVMVTVIDSPYDEFSRLRDKFISDPELLGRYNQLKRDHEGKDPSDYWAAKREFFGPNGQSRLL